MVRPIMAPKRTVHQFAGAVAEAIEKREDGEGPRRRRKASLVKASLRKRAKVGNDDDWGRWMHLSLVANETTSTYQEDKLLRYIFCILAETREEQDC